MDFRLDSEHQEFLKALRSFIQREVTPELQAEMLLPQTRPWGGSWMAIGPECKTFLRKLGTSGWLGVSWPKERGGKGLPLIYQHLLISELSYHELPYGGHTVNTLGPIIARVGTEEQRKKYLPPILRGETQYSLGYTEPEAGTDLASIQTRAVRDGDEYVINGVKLYCSAAHITDYIWLAARTDPSAPKHKGISILMVPTGSPGISVHPLKTMADEQTNEVVFENVHVPITALIGEENQGWSVLAQALDYQRVTVSAREASQSKLYLDTLIKYINVTKINGKTLASDPVIRHQVAELFVASQVSKLFAYRNTWMIDRKLPVDKEAAMSKAWMTELNQRILSVALQIMGPYGQLQMGSPSAPFDGSMEAKYRGSPMVKFGGGANEVQRNIVAERGLGLPR